MGGKPENCVTFSSPEGITRTVSRDLLKISEFCKMFQIANNAYDSELKNLFISFIMVPIKVP